MRQEEGFQNSNTDKENASSVAVHESSPCESFYFSLYLHISNEVKASLIAQLVNNPHAMQETLVIFLGWEDPLEKG